MTRRSAYIPRTAVRVVLVLLVLATAREAAADTDVLIIDRDGRGRSARVVEINDLVLVHLDRSGGLHSMPVTECLALIAADAAPPEDAAPAPPGLLLRSDGQRLPGVLATGEADDGDRLAWTHPWLGRLDVPLDQIAAVSFRRGAPLPEPGRLDIVVLANGDRYEGFVSSLGDPITLSQTGDDGTSRDVRIPLARVDGVALVAPPRSAEGRRLSFRDGTLLDARSIGVGDDGYLEMEPASVDETGPSIQVRLSDVRAILFDPTRMVALSGLAPTEVDATGPRFSVPAPRLVDERAPLGLGAIEYRGPLLVRYALPEDCRRFAAEARLADGAAPWGDFELIVRDDDREVHRSRLNAEQPTATVNVALSGSELTIELTQGAHGPIFDRLLLTRAMLLCGE